MHFLRLLGIDSFHGGSAGPLHGAVWYWIMHAQLENPWQHIFTLCPYANVWSSIVSACVHGFGHGMLLVSLDHDTEMRKKYGPCNMPAYGATGLYSETAILRATSKCAAAPSSKHALFCGGGIFDFYKMSMTDINGTRTDDFRLSPCGRISSLSGACFTYNLKRNRKAFTYVSDQANFLFDCLNDPSLASETNVVGCVYAQSQDIFFGSAFVSHMGRRALDIKLLSFQACGRYIPSAPSFLSQVNIIRAFACIAGSVRWFHWPYVHEAHAEKDVDHVCKQLHTIDINLNTSLREQAFDLCMLLGMQRVVPNANTSEDWPAWLAF